MRSDQLLIALPSCMPWVHNLPDHGHQKDICPHCYDCKAVKLESPDSSSVSSAQSKCHPGFTPLLLCPTVNLVIWHRVGSSILKVSWPPRRKSSGLEGNFMRGLFPCFPCTVTNTSASVPAAGLSLVHSSRLYHCRGALSLHSTQIDISC